MGGVRPLAPEENVMAMTEERRRHIKMLAHGFAAMKYQHKHLEATEDEAWDYAGQHWRQHLDTVFDFLAICQALDEADAAPMN
jgi:hypothetical protein